MLQYVLTLIEVDKDNIQEMTSALVRLLLHAMNFPGCRNEKRGMYILTTESPIGLLDMQTHILSHYQFTPTARSRPRRSMISKISTFDGSSSIFTDQHRSDSSVHSRHRPVAGKEIMYKVLYGNFPEP